MSEEFFEEVLFLRLKSCRKTCLLAVSSWPRGTSAGDFIIGCGKSHGHMEVYRVDRETFLSTYIRWEEPEASCKSWSGSVSDRGVGASHCIERAEGATYMEQN